MIHHYFSQEFYQKILLFIEAVLQVKTKENKEIVRKYIKTKTNNPRKHTKKQSIKSKEETQSNYQDPCKRDAKQ